MAETVTAQAGGFSFQAELDLADGKWTAAEELPEGEFPFVAEWDGKRYELYSDHTFGEVELDDEASE